ncbi:MAG TPA: hypothetical protein VKM72_23570 [Thermoanaerobaculia bacterium]|nr:hypothetical protein [Thermoanaerobaculia bacterium]
MIRLLAIAPEDGWAFVRSADRILLLRPPYGKRRHPAVEESVVARAVAVEGFEAADQVFPDWPALFAHLEERFLAGRKALPAALAPEAIERILRHAPPSALESLLDRIEQEILPGRQWDAAGELLARFLAVDTPATAGLRPRAAELLVSCQQARSATGERWQRMTGAGRAPLATAKYGLEPVRAHAERIRQRGFFPAA